MTVTRLATVLLAVALLGGCGRKDRPTGDVVATVNGHDITTSDLEAEARSRGIRFDTPDGAAAQKNVLRFVVSRAMLVDTAQQAHLDIDPRIMADRRRADAAILAQAQVAKMMATAPVVTPAQIDAYRTANPHIFAGRQAMALDEIQVRLSGPLPAGGRDTAAALLEQVGALGLPVQQGRATVDSANLPKAAFDALIAHPTVPVRLDSGTTTATFATLAGAHPNPAPEAEQRQAATRVLQAQWLDKSIDAAVATLRKEGKVTYKPGYQP